MSAANEALKRGLAVLHEQHGEEFTWRGTTFTAIETEPSAGSLGRTAPYEVDPPFDCELEIEGGATIWANGFPPGGDVVTNSASGLNYRVVAVVNKRSHKPSIQCKRPND